MNELKISERKFELVSEFSPQGDQPQAIEQLIASIQSGKKYQTLLGATGTGKTFTAAQVIAQLNRPTLVIAHNKTLAAQLCSEFKDFFPHEIVKKENALYLDLPLVVRNQLKSTGIPKANIADCGICSCCDKRFFSYRREGIQAGRMLSVMILKPSGN